MRLGSLPTVYLDLSWGCKNTALELWNGVVEKCEERLSSWKRHYLSLGGRVVLVNNVLDALPTYVMSLFPLPRKVGEEIDVLRRNFVWQGNKENQAIHLVKCKPLTTTKKRGGLGIKNLKIQNINILLKWLWRYNQEENAPWQGVVIKPNMRKMGCRAQRLSAIPIGLENGSLSDHIRELLQPIPTSRWEMIEKTLF